MLRLIRFLIFGDGHRHVWADVQDGTITDPKSGNVIGRWYDCKCSVCGARKRFRHTAGYFL